MTSQAAQAVVLCELFDAVEEKLRTYAFDRPQEARALAANFGERLQGAVKTGAEVLSEATQRPQAVATPSRRRKAA